ncbi:hypothetical protein GGR56DRAFT_583113 [Xylariaceae sp. FL0804]|nr:hypothetical protein GGR56DRAFT_583113 [Xylariaceae sp. FL0804]
MAAPSVSKLATPNASDPLTDGPVRVLLSSLLPTSLPTRNLVITSDKPSVKIGRSSKDTAKGFVAAADSAWFESPVMSRKHAELTIDFNTSPKSAYLTDVGSLHGTFLRGDAGLSEEVRLGHGQTVKLNSGDTVRFGVDIVRANRTKETIPPFLVDFHMEEERQPTPQPTNGVFTVPDGVDDEDYTSDDDSVCMTDAFDRHAHEGLSSFQGLHELPPGPALARTDKPDGQCAAPTTITSDVIDLTSEPEHDSGPEKDSGSELNQVLDSITPDLAHVPSSQGGCEHVVTKPLQNGDVGLFLCDSDGDDDAQMESRSLHQPREGSDESDYTSDISDQESLSSGSSESSEMADDYDGEEDDASELADDYDGEEDIVSEEEDSDLPHSIAYYEDGVSVTSESSNDTRSDSSLRSPSILEAYGQTAQMEDHVPLDPATVMAHLYRPRQPSPSDAAMFKSQPPFMQAKTSSETPVLLHKPAVQSSRIARAKALGEKTGKQEYFAAREFNRLLADFNTGVHGAPLPTSALREALPEQTDESYHSSTGPQILLRPLQLSHPDHDRSGDVDRMAATTAPCENQDPSVNLDDAGNTQDSAWSASGDQFINHPRTEDLPCLQAERLQTPDLDMTSAYTFQQSKLATEASTSSSVRRVPIKDLLAQEPRIHVPMQDALPAFPGVQHDEAVSPNSKKRSFLEAFEESEDAVEPTSTTLDCVSARIGGSAEQMRNEREATLLSQLQRKKARTGLQSGCGSLKLLPASQ